MFSPRVELDPWPRCAAEFNMRANFQDQRQSTVNHWRQLPDRKGHFLKHQHAPMFKTLWNTELKNSGCLHRAEDFVRLEIC